MRLGCVLLHLLGGPAILSSLNFGLCDGQGTTISTALNKELGTVNDTYLHQKPTIKSNHARWQSALVDHVPISVDTYLLIPPWGTFNRRLALALQVLLFLMLYFLIE